MCLHKYHFSSYFIYFIPAVGIEPTLQKERDFESRASANSATPAQYKEKLPLEVIMERKIGLTPIPRSGKERVLRVELLPLNINYGAEDRTYTYTSFREGTCSKS